MRALFKSLLLLIIALGIGFSSCKKNESVTPKKSELSIQENITASAPAKNQSGYQFQSLDVPPELGNNASAYGNNNIGKIVGNYVTKNQESHGFIFDNGQFTDVFLQKADKDNRGGLTDINDESVSIGSFNYPKNIDHNQLIHSFQLSAAGISTILPDAIPGALLTEAMGVNNAGTIVGFYYDENSSRHGFIFSNGVFTTYNKPGAARTLLMGINNQGKIVGFYRDANGIGRGFTLFDGITEEIIFPGATETRPHGINKTGQIVGEYIDNTGITHGFLLKGGNYTTLDFPGSLDTALLGINDYGVMVGTYSDVSRSISRGLIATPN